MTYSDQAATALIDVLTTVFVTLENHYRAQIRRHHKRQYDLDLPLVNCEMVPEPQTAMM